MILAQTSILIPGPVIVGFFPTLAVSWTGEANQSFNTGPRLGTAWEIQRIRWRYDFSGGPPNLTSAMMAVRTGPAPIPGGWNVAATDLLMEDRVETRFSSELRYDSAGTGYYGIEAPLSDRLQHNLEYVPVVPLIITSPTVPWLYAAVAPASESGFIGARVATQITNFRVNAQLEGEIQ